MLIISEKKKKKLRPPKIKTKEEVTCSRICILMNTKSEIENLYSSLTHPLSPIPSSISINGEKGQAFDPYHYNSQDGDCYHYSSLINVGMSLLH